MKIAKLYILAIIAFLAYGLFADPSTSIFTAVKDLVSNCIGF